MSVLTGTVIPLEDHLKKLDRFQVDNALSPFRSAAP